MAANQALNEALAKKAYAEALQIEERRIALAANLAEKQNIQLEEARVNLERMRAMRDEQISDARKAAADAGVAIIAAATAEREDRERAADWRYQHIYPFHAATNEASVRQCMDRLNVWDQLSPVCDIEVVFTSPGGDAIWGMALFDYLRELSRKGHRIVTSTRGYAASMAGILLQAGDQRIMGKEAWLLIHELSLGASGKIGEIEDTAEWAKHMCQHVVDIFVNRSGGKLDREYFKDHWSRRDWWLDAESALSLGIVDEIR